MPTPTRSLSTCLLLCALTSGRARTEDYIRATLIPLQGPPVAADLTALDGTLATFQDATARRYGLPITKIVRWGSLVDSADPEQVMLVDGSVLIARVAAMDRTEVTVESDTWGTITLPRHCIRGIVWQPPSEQLARWQLRDRIASKTVDVDELTLSHGDRLSGRLLTLADGTLQYETTTGIVSLKAAAVSSWQASEVSNPHVADSGPQSLAGLRDGSLLTASSVTLGATLRVELSCGVSLETAPEIQLAAEHRLTFFQPANPRLTFLSDLPPLGYKHIPLFSFPWPWRADRNVLGGPLSASGHLYANGLGMHSTSRLAFAVKGDYDEFQAEAAVDQTAGQGGSVVFRVFSSEDGGAWKMVYKSDTVRGGMAPVPIRVPLAGARALALVVDFADRGDQLDRANWIDARLVRGL